MAMGPIDRKLTLQDFINEGLIRPDHNLKRTAINRLLSLTPAEVMAAKAIGVKLGYPEVEQILDNHGEGKRLPGMAPGKKPLPKMGIF